MTPTEQNKKALTQQQLQRMSENSTFANGGRMYSLLAYLVNSELEGQSKQLNQTSLAIDVFGRDKNFDPTTDSIVRVEVGRLRNKLREYYSLAGKDDPVTITIPKGRYIPSIEIKKHDQVSPPDNILPGFSMFSKSWRKNYAIPILFGILVVLPLWFFVKTNDIQDQNLPLSILDNSVSVLTFENLSPDLEDAFYSVAIREAILNQLQSNDEIQLISLASQS